MLSPTPQAIEHEYGLEGLLGGCGAYDFIDSAIAIFDTQGTLRYGNAAFSHFNQAVRDSVENLGQHQTLLQSSQFQSWLRTSVAADHAQTLRRTFYYAPLIQVELSVYARPIVSPGGKPEGAMLTLGEESIEYGKRHVARSQDTLRTLAKRLENHVREKRTSDKMIRILLRDAPFAMILFNNVRQVLQVNRAAEILFGYPASRLIGQHARVFLPSNKHSLTRQAGNDNWKIDQDEIDGLNSEQKTIPLLRNTSTVIDENNDTLVIEAYFDLTDQKRTDQEIHNLAFYDVLTNLPNRRLLMDRINQSLASSTRNEQHGAILFLDLDDFKTLNDTQGHDIGDLLLIEVAHCLQGCVREDDTVARFGGDEFVIVLQELGHQQDEAATHAEMVAEKIHTVLAQSHQLGHIEYHCSTSIGINLFFDHPGTADELLKQADMAMYQAKHAGRNATRFFDPAMQSTLESRITLEKAMRSALLKQQFQLHYQIQVDAASRPIGAEALLRWQHPEMGMIPPAQFIPLAEENGMILPIGLWVMETACSQLEKWQSDPLFRELNIAVNVSSKQFRQEGFVGQVTGLINKYGINPNRFKMELTESLILNNVEDSIQKMQELKSIGVAFSMDDFGTGYSSLSYLKRLPLDQIKIDQSFVRDISTDASDAAIVHTIIAMAATLGLKVIAEGVETEDQHKFLEMRGCPAFQGHLFGRALPIDQLEKFLRKIPEVAASSAAKTSVPPYIKVIH